MNVHAAHAALDEVDAYVDALLDAGPAAADLPIAGVPIAEVAMAAMPAPDAAPEPAADAHDAVPLPPPAPPPTPTPLPRSMHAIEPTAPAQPARPDAGRAIAPVRESAAPQPQRWVRVAVGADSYALELLCVQEVVRLAPIVAMRGAAAAVLGVMNLRGRIVPVFDLGLWLGVGQVHPDERSRIVVVEREDELIGVLVSAVEDVVTLSRDRIEPPVPGADRGPTLGVARVGPAPTVLLDARALYG